MADASPRPRSGYLKANKDCPPDKEINILLLGQTGIGKTTFINSFANYLVNNTLEEAINDDMQILIPTSLSYTDPETFKQQLITIGDKKNHEKINENGESCTQQCRSFIFPIGDRNLRLIDTPGMGDTRGSEQDNINLFEILTYISHYECLNGICIFLKPNEERLTISFRLIIKQVLHYLHSSASENIIFIFTNARSTLYSAGSSKKILKTLLDEYQNKNHLEIPFTKDNTFLLDNEPFRYLAFHKNGIQIVDEQNESYTKSWNHTIKEYERLVSYISQRPRHVVGNDLSLNGAEQLIRKLVRPIAETLRLIQQNIQLANKCKRDLLKNQPNTSPGLFQITIQVVPLQHPKLVCFGKNCSRVVDVNNENKIVLYRNCQEISYLSGVIQETIQDPRVEQCKVIDRQTGKPLKIIISKSRR
jgi:GTPase SAR1 family protein